MKKKTVSPLAFILNCLNPFCWQVIGVLLVACYWAAYISLQPYALKLILDNIAQNPSWENLFLPIVFFCTLFASFLITFRLYDYLCLLFYPKLKAKIIEETTCSVSMIKYDFFQNQASGSIATKIRDLSSATAQIVQIIIERVFGGILALIIAFFALAKIHPAISIILVFWACSIITVSWFATKKARALSELFSDASSHMIGGLVDHFNNILNVNLFVSFQYEQKKLKENLNNITESDKTLRWYLLKLSIVQGVLTIVMLISCLSVLISSLNSRHITVGDFALVLALCLSFSDILRTIIHELSNFSSIYGAISQGIKLINSNASRDKTEAKDICIKKGEIKFDKVFFQYRRNLSIFKNKSITIAAGQKVGLVGYSGSGKSTFVNLILRLFEVTSGNIFIDNQDISEVTLSSLHKNITMIPQDPILFHQSILENIRYGKLDATHDEIFEAAKKAQIHEFILSLPNSYNSLVGERGVKLSGGQRQRIAIARAILKNSPILILDEATSSLDSITENIIRDIILKFMNGKTTIVIAHRLSTILQMDRILVFQQGRIVEDGSHAQLLKNGGLYKTLWEAQTGDFIPKQAPFP